MPKQIKQRPAQRYQPKEPVLRYQGSDSQSDRARRDIERQPQLGPYEFQYEVQHGYAAQSRFA